MFVLVIFLSSHSPPSYPFERETTYRLMFCRPTIEVALLGRTYPHWWMWSSGDIRESCPGFNTYGYLQQKIHPVSHLCCACLVCFRNLGHGIVRRATTPDFLTVGFWVGCGSPQATSFRKRAATPIVEGVEIKNVRHTCRQVHLQKRSKCIR